MDEITFVPETPFVTEDNDLVYCLYQDGWDKGEPRMVNDICISITSRHSTDAQKKLINDYICECLNKKFPIKKEGIK